MKYVWKFQFNRAGTLRTITNVQSAQFTQGRSGLLDTYSGGGGTITCFNPGQWTHTPEIGDLFYASITYSGTDHVQFYGYIKDLRIDYGQVAAQDVAVISVEDFIAGLGRVQLVSQSISQAKTDAQAATLVDTLAGGVSGSTASAQTYSGSTLQYLNKLVATENARMTYFPGVMGYQLYWQNRGFVNSQQGDGFTDSAIGLSKLKYDSFVFGALSDNSFTKVVVNPEGLASQAAGTGGRGVSIETVDVSTAQALNNAEYILNRLQTGTRLPIEISCTDQQQSNAFLHLINKPELLIGQKQTVLFRGTIYSIVLEGSIVSVSLDQTRFTFQVSAADLNNYLILNDGVFGQLDNNKLGF